MLGLLISNREARELELLLKKELEELMLNLEDERIDGLLRRSMEERYKIIFRLFSRLASPQELSKYVRTSSK